MFDRGKVVACFVCFFNPRIKIVYFKFFDLLKQIIIGHLDVDGECAFGRMDPFRLTLC